MKFEIIILASVAGLMTAYILPSELSGWCQINLAYDHIKMLYNNLNSTSAPFANQSNVLSGLIPPNNVNSSTITNPCLQLKINHQLFSDTLSLVHTNSTEVTTLRNYVTPCIKEWINLWDSGYNYANTNGSPLNSTVDGILLYRLFKYLGDFIINVESQPSNNCI